MEIGHNIDDRLRLPFPDLNQHLTILLQIHFRVAISKFIHSQHTIFLILQHLRHKNFAAGLLISHFLFQNLKDRHTAVAIEIRSIQPRIIRYPKRP